MKKTAVAAIRVIALSSVLVLFTSMSAEANAPLLDRSLSLSSLSNELKTPETIARYMWRNFRFENDRRAFGTEEYWQSPEEFLTSRQGDCEDFALFAQHHLKLNGVESFLLNIYSNRTSHTVCVFQEDGKYSVIDGAKVIHYKAKDIKALLTKIDPFWKTGAIVIPSSTSRTGQIIRTITK